MSLTDEWIKKTQKPRDGSAIKNTSYSVRTQVCFSAPICQLTVNLNSSFREPDIVFWPPWALYIHGAHTYHRQTFIHIKQQYFKWYMKKKIWVCPYNELFNNVSYDNMDGTREHYAK